MLSRGQKDKLINLGLSQEFVEANNQLLSSNWKEVLANPSRVDVDSLEAMEAKRVKSVEDKHAAKGLDDDLDEGFVDTDSSVDEEVTDDSD